MAEDFSFLPCPSLRPGTIAVYCAAPVEVMRAYSTPGEGGPQTAVAIHCTNVRVHYFDKPVKELWPRLTLQVATLPMTAFARRRLTGLIDQLTMVMIMGGPRKDQLGFTAFRNGVAKFAEANHGLDLDQWTAYCEFWAGVEHVPK